MNQIALYAHRGWAASAIVQALETSGAHLRILHRAESDISSLSNKTQTIEVDLEDEQGLTSALQDTDILICLVGHGGVVLQHNLIKAAVRAGVKLFVPSDLAARYDVQGIECIPVNKEKMKVELAAREAGLPMTIVLCGNFAEFTLNTLAMGVDLNGNRIVYTGDSDAMVVNLCTRSYVATAYVQLFLSTPVERLSHRIIGLSELRVTGHQIAEVMECKHSVSPSIRREATQTLEDLINRNAPGALALYCRKIWGTGQQANMLGQDLYDVKHYTKATLDDLIVKGGLRQYRSMPHARDLLITLFEGI